MNSRGIVFWSIQGPGWILLVYLLIAQAIPVFDYDIGVRMGTQEPASAITDVGVAFWYGFAFGDLLAYIPLLAVGLAFYWMGNRAAGPVLGAALGITVYWPIVSLAAVVKARGAEGWQLSNETAYWIVLPAITAWAALALWGLLAENSQGAER